jgi:hypothetical protein
MFSQSNSNNHLDQFYKFTFQVAVRDAKRHMWMEVGRVSAEVQKLKVQELVVGHYFRIMK